MEPCRLDDARVFGQRKLGERSSLVGWPPGGADVRYVRPIWIFKTSFGTDFDARHLRNFMGQFGDNWDNLGHLHQDFYGFLWNSM